MVRVGFHVMIKFDDGLWYRGEIMTIKEKHNELWVLEVEFEDGDSGSYDYPDEEVRLDVEQIHGVLLYRLHMATIQPCMKAWFIYYLVKNHRLPEWKDCKVYLTNYNRFPVDAKFLSCRRSQVRNKIDQQEFAHATKAWNMAKKEFEICLFKCEIQELGVKDDVGDALAGGKERKHKLAMKKLMRTFRVVHAVVKLGLIIKEMKIERELNKI